MKKRFLWLLACAAAFLSCNSLCFSQGRINLDNYNAAPFPQVTYGASFATNLAARGVLNGMPTGISWTMGFYYALGDVTANVANDPGGTAEPSSLGGGLALASGSLGDTAPQLFLPGYFETVYDAVINGYATGLITVEVLVYSGSDYSSSTMRGHSAAFTMTPATTGTAPLVGSFMPAFSVNIVPEPSTFALAAVTSGLILWLRGKLAQVKT